MLERARAGLVSVSTIVMLIVIPSENNNQRAEMNKRSLILSAENWVRKKISWVPLEQFGWL